jgi:hypothetical protein
MIPALSAFSAVHFTAETAESAEDHRRSSFKTVEKRHTDSDRKHAVPFLSVFFLFLLSNFSEWFQPVSSALSAVSAVNIPRG